MSKGNTFETDLLKLIFNAAAVGGGGGDRTIAGIMDNAASAPLTNLYVSLHTADPGETGNQQTNETPYTGYARVAVARTSGGWTVTNNSVSPVADVVFGECTNVNGSSNIGYAAVGTAASGAGNILYKGALSPTIVIGVGVIPTIKTTSTITEE
jgi:hypothetical protein